MYVKEFICTQIYAQYANKQQCIATKNLIVYKHRAMLMLCGLHLKQGRHERRGAAVHAQHLCGSSFGRRRCCIVSQGFYFSIGF